MDVEIKAGLGCIKKRTKKDVQKKSAEVKMLSGMSTKLEEISDGMLRYEKEVLQEIHASTKKYMLIGKKNRKEERVEVTTLK